MTSISAKLDVAVSLLFTTCSCPRLTTRATHSNTAMQTKLAAIGVPSLTPWKPTSGLSEPQVTVAMRQVQMAFTAVATEVANATWMCSKMCLLTHMAPEHNTRSTLNFRSKSLKLTMRAVVDSLGIRQS